jgi:hypothetical protein
MIRAYSRVTLVCGLLAASQAWASPYPLEQILPKSATEKLAAAGVETSDQLLAAAAKRPARAKLAKTTGLGLKLLTEWTKMCDLLRIKGVGPEMTRLLGAAKVTTVAQLRRQRVSRLMKKVLAANEKQKITDNPPSEKHLAGWIAEAKKLKIVLR